VAAASKKRSRRR